MKQPGFSLVELMVAMTSLGVMAVGATSIMGTVQKFKATTLSRSETSWAERVVDSSLAKITKSNYTSFIASTEHFILNCLNTNYCSPVIAAGKDTRGYVPVSLRLLDGGGYTPTAVGGNGKSCPGEVGPSCPFTAKTRIRPICHKEGSNPCEKVIGFSLELAVDRHFAADRKRLEQPTHEVFRRTVFFPTRLDSGLSVNKLPPIPTPPPAPKECPTPDPATPEVPRTGCFSDQGACRNYIALSHLICKYPLVHCENWTAVGGELNSMTEITLATPTPTATPVAKKTPSTILIEEPMKNGQSCWSFFLK